MSRAKPKEVAVATAAPLDPELRRQLGEIRERVSYASNALTGGGADLDTVSGLLSVGMRVGAALTTASIVLGTILGAGPQGDELIDGDSTAGG